MSGIIRESIVQIEIYLTKKNCCNFISTQHVTQGHGSTREHGSTNRKLLFSLIAQLFTKINKVIFV